MSDGVDQEIVADSLVGLINQLEEVPPLAPVEMTPQTPGWAVLGALVLTLLIWLGRKWLARWQKRAYRRAALRELRQVGDSPAAVSTVLKRAAIAGYSRQDVSALSGQAWLSFLDETGGAGFARNAPDMARASFVPDAGQDIVGLNKLACHWVRHHKARGAEARA